LQVDSGRVVKFEMNEGGHLWVNLGILLSVGQL